MSLTGNFDKLNRSANNPADEKKDDESVTNYAAAGPTRNLSFVQLDGKRKFLNYAYLVECDFEPETNKIILEYTSSTVTLTGQNLEELYDSLVSQIPKRIAVVDKRYVALKGETEPVVTEIAIEKKER